MKVNTLRPRQNGGLFPDNIVKYIFLNENIWISLKISLTFVPKVQINNIPAWIQIMAWCCLGDKPLSELMIASLLTHIYITGPQWVKHISYPCSLKRPHIEPLMATLKWKYFDQIFCQWLKGMLAYYLGAVSIYRGCLTCMGIPIVEICSYDRFVSTMRFLLYR